MTRRLPPQLFDAFQGRPQVRYGTVTSISPGVCTVRVAAGEIPVVTINGAPLSVGDFVGVQRQGVASYLLAVPGTSPWALGQTWWAQDPSTGRCWWLTQPYIPGSAAPVPNFAGGMFTAPLTTTGAPGFYAAGYVSHSYAFSPTGLLTGEWGTPNPHQQFLLPYALPAQGIGLTLSQASEPGPVYAPPFPPVLATTASLATGTPAGNQTLRWSEPSGAPCFDPAQAAPAYSNGMFWSERDQVVYFLGYPNHDGYAGGWEWDALDPVTLNAVSYASGASLGSNYLLGTAFGPDVGIVQVDQQTGYAWCCTSTHQIPSLNGLFAVDPKSGALIQEVILTTAYFPLVVNVDAATRTVFVAAQSASAPSGSYAPWYLQTWDADTYQMIGQTTVPNTSDLGGSFTIGVLPGTGTAIFGLLGTAQGSGYIYIIARSGVATAIPFPASGFPSYFATLQ